MQSTPRCEPPIWPRLSPEAPRIFLGMVAGSIAWIWSQGPSRDVAWNLACVPGLGVSLGICAHTYVCACEGLRTYVAYLGAATRAAYAHVLLSGGRRPPALLQGGSPFPVGDVRLLVGLVTSSCLRGLRGNVSSTSLFPLR